MSQSYQEGDVFSIPLRQSGFALGLLARKPRRGTVVLGYFFGPRRKQSDLEENLSSLRADGAVLACRLKDTDLHRGFWRVIGPHATWDRRDWPIPPFLRKEGLSGRGIRVEYADDNLTVPATQAEAGVTDHHLAEDIVFDPERLVEVLERLLVEQKTQATVDPGRWSG